MDKETGIIELKPSDLALRWRKTVGTLKVWRFRNQGPSYNKRGRSITYSLSDILVYESKNKIIPIQ